MSFSHADVQNIIQLLDASHFDELVLEMDGIKLELRRGGAAGPAVAPTAALSKTPSAQPAPTAPAAASASTGVNAVSAPASAPSTIQSADNSSVQEVRAPMLGTFYSAPKPGAAPFVAVGDRVEADTVVGIIEVMKLMNSTPAGISGEIIEILVKDGDLVEYEQPLMRVRT